MDAPITLRYPARLATDRLDFVDGESTDSAPRVASASLASIWSESAGDSRWFDWRFDNQRAGGRLTPNEEDVELELWLENRRRVPARPRAVCERRRTVSAAGRAPGQLFSEPVRDRLPYIDIVAG